MTALSLFLSCLLLPFANKYIVKKPAAWLAQKIKVWRKT